MKVKKRWIDYIGLILPLVLALMCLASVSVGSHQAALPIPMPQELVGEYSYDGENWYPLTEDATISALEGDVILRGHFLREMQEGWMLCFYRNHIAVSLEINGEIVYMDDIQGVSDIRPELFASMCAREWTEILLPRVGEDDLVEICLHNPHKAGNEEAYRELLSTLCAKAQGSDILEKNLKSYGDPFRIVGGLFAVAGLMLLGAAAAAVSVRVSVGGVLLKLGLLSIFSGGFIVFDTVDISFWSELNVLNTYAGQLCMMMAVLCLGHLAGDALSGRRRSVSKIAVFLSALFDSVLIVLSFADVMVIYDTLLCWSVSQLILCPLLAVCCGLELYRNPRKTLTPCSLILMFAGILMDIAGVGGGIVWRNPCSKIMFAVLFVIHVIFGARNVVRDHRGSIRAEKLEKELEDSRIAIMLSQIKPHFLYNVLNTIYHLYRKEPETAQEAVSSFAEYLRCNMLSIEKSEAIPFSEEYRHIQTYLSLEQIRFRGKLDVVYDVEVTEFKVPPLTIEPLVENAVKHGVTKKRGGGIVTISTRRVESGFVVTVSDTGNGFDPDHYMEDGKPHVGIRNVRERLKRMANGTLVITSTQDGTVAVVTIPTER